MYVRIICKLLKNIIKSGSWLEMRRIRVMYAVTDDCCIISGCQQHQGRLTVHSAP